MGAAGQAAGELGQAVGVRVGWGWQVGGVMRMVSTESGHLGFCTTLTVELMPELVLGAWCWLIGIMEHGHKT